MNNNNNDNTDIEVCPSIDTESSDISYLQNWLVNATNAGTTFRSGHEYYQLSNLINDSGTATALTPAESSKKQEAQATINPPQQSSEVNEPTSIVEDSNSECSELVELDWTSNDVTPATQRWCHKVKSNKLDGLQFLGDRMSREEVECNLFPPGCSFDLTRPPSPTDIRDFPEATFTPLPRPKYMINTTVQQNPFDDTLDNLTRNLVVNVKCMIRTIDIDQDQSTRVYRLFRKEDGTLVDSGANICMTRSSKGLVNIRTIDPITVGVAVKSEQQSVTTCNQMGYLPMLREDGTYHYQPFLINPHASDMIMSLASIVEAGKDFFSWEQVGFKDGRPGYARIFDKDGNLLLLLKCEKRQGLYYHPHQRIDRDSEPICISPDLSDVNHLSTIDLSICDQLQSILPSESSTLPASSTSYPDFEHPTSVHNVSRPTPLPTLDETSTFNPILDPLCEIPFEEDTEYTVYHTSAQRPNLTPLQKKSQTRIKPINPRKQLESELWAARLGHCGEHQLDLLPSCATGLPNQFDYHPFRFIDHKEMAYARRQAAKRTAERVKEIGKRFYADFGFIRSSTSDINVNKRRKSRKKGEKNVDRVVQSADGYNCYLAIVDEASRYTWIFLCKSKEPPIDEMASFLAVWGLETGGTIRCDQGGELARSGEFKDRMLRDYKYLVEPTGADSPSQNGGVERVNDTLAVLVRTLLYGSNLPAKYWSYALIHAAYLLNRRVHSVTKRTPFEGWFGRQPDLKELKTFGSRVCVKRSTKRHTKLDRNDFRGIFVGYSATDNNIRYIDLDTGIVKTSHHAVFDECWYTHHDRPPTAQLLYDLGLMTDDDFASLSAITIENIPPAAYPPIAKSAPLPSTHEKITQACKCPLPERLTEIPNSVAARAASTKICDPYAGTALQSNTDSAFVEEYGITRRDMAQVYISPHPYDDAFEEEMMLRDFNSDTHPSAGFKFVTINGRLIVEHISPSTHGAKIPRWRSRLKGAWLRRIGDVEVNNLKEVHAAFAALSQSRAKSCWLTFSHPEIKHGLTNEGIPQVNIDQLNPRHMFNSPEWESYDVTLPERPALKVRREFEGGCFNLITPWTKAMKLTRGKLLKTDDWVEWNQSEYKQLDQYMDQGMFGEPVKVDDQGAVFNLVWTYVIKELDKRKKARCTCDGSTRAGQVRVLDHTYANCVDQTSSRLFYACAAAENLLIYGADVSNAFAEAPPPKQGFYIRPDTPFREWWTNHLKRDPIPPGYVIPVLSAMQGHPESGRLWEKHADKFLRELGLTPTIHEPCLYSGLIEGERVIFKRQVDDFAVAAPSERIANILFDMIDDRITFPLKRMGLIDMFNGMDIEQTRDYVKMSCKTYLERIMSKHFDNGLTVKEMPNRPTPLPTTGKFIESFMGANGDPDEKVQRDLVKEMGFGYRQGIGELIYAMVTCRPDLSFAVTAASQHSVCPAKIHFHGVKHMLKYAYITRDDGIIFWRPEPNHNLRYVEPPPIMSHAHDLLLDGRPEHHPYELHSYMDGTWASCLKTRRSYSGMCLRLAGGTVAYKSKLQPTVAQSSTESEFMSATDCGKMILYVRSVMWDLGIPQHAATIAYEDNDACTAMANARKPTTRTRHMDTKYHVLCEWVERDLIKLARVDTSQNLADHFTKQLGPNLFHRHVDYILGKVPPTYSSCFKRLKGMLEQKSITEQPTNITLPKAITKTPLAAAAAKLWISWSKVTGILV